MLCAENVNKVVSLGAETYRLRKEAFDWLYRELARLGKIEYGFPSKMDRVLLGWDVSIPPPEECVSSIFYDEKTDQCFFRQDWLETPKYVTAKCQLVLNWDEFRADNPQLAERLLNNGVRLYLYYGGPNGGTTRKIAGKKWNR